MEVGAIIDLHKAVYQRQLKPEPEKGPATRPDRRKQDQQADEGNRDEQESATDDTQPGTRSVHERAEGDGQHALG